MQVTDDVSIIEAIGKPVKMTEGSYTNIKVLTCMIWPVHVMDCAVTLTMVQVTTPDDMSVAERFLSER